MLTWFENAFPCCKTREKAIKVDKETLISIHNKGSIEEKETMFPSVILYEDGIEMNNKKASILSTASSKESPQRKEQSLAIEKIDISFIETCETCNATEIGFCTGCPGKKYCKNCFKDFHIENSAFHRFVLYKRKEEYHKLTKGQTGLARYLRKISESNSFN